MSALFHPYLCGRIAAEWLIKMKKFISMILALCLMVCVFSVVSSADDVSDNVFHYMGKDIVVEGEGLSATEMQRIADYIAYGDTNDDGISTHGILCIFGHNLETTYALETTHNAYGTSPKCLVKRYKVERCTRSSCDYINKELVNSYRTSECHG